MGVSKNRGTPKMDGLEWKTLLKKWMIWGYPYFWKHPYIKSYVKFEYHTKSPQNHQGFRVPDTLGRAAAESGAGAPWRSSGVASVGAGPGLGRFRGESEPWKLGVQTSGFG